MLRRRHDEREDQSYVGMVVLRRAADDMDGNVASFARLGKVVGLERRTARRLHPVLEKHLLQPGDAGPSMRTPVSRQQGSPFEALYHWSRHRARSSSRSARRRSEVSGASGDSASGCSRAGACGRCPARHRRLSAAAGVPCRRRGRRRHRAAAARSHRAVGAIRRRRPAGEFAVRPDEGLEVHAVAGASMSASMLPKISSSSER